MDMTRGRWKVIQESSWMLNPTVDGDIEVSTDQESSQQLQQIGQIEIKVQKTEEVYVHNGHLY